MDLNPQSTVTLHTGRKMPVIGLGTWKLTDNTAEDVEFAINLGYRMIDTSGDYGTEPGIAEALAQAGVDRPSLYLVTKVEEYENAYESAQKNVSELQLGSADLILIHRPPMNGAGEALWEGLVRAQDKGIARDIGVSNYSIDQIRQLHESTGVMPSVNQIEWTPFGYSSEMLEFCKNNRIIIQAYSPLTRAQRLDDETVTEIGRHYNKTPAQILLRWNLQIGTVPLPKAADHDHMRENIDIFDFELNSDDLHRLNNLNESYSALGGLQY